jgi:hypothetical protein
LLSETRVIWRKLDGLKSNAHRSMEGLWRQRLTARWTLHQYKRRDSVTSESPAPPNEGGEGMSGPPTSRSDVLCE